MKNLTQILVLITFLVTSSLCSAKLYSEDIAYVKGVITCKNHVIKNAKLLVSQNNMIVDTVFTDMNGNFSIPLAFDQIYTIIIESPQFDTKWIVLSTILPDKMRTKDHTFRCEIEINPKTMSALKELANKEQ